MTRTAARLDDCIEKRGNPVVTRIVRNCLHFVQGGHGASRSGGEANAAVGGRQAGCVIECEARAEAHGKLPVWAEGI